MTTTYGTPPTQLTRPRHLPAYRTYPTYRIQPASPRRLRQPPKHLRHTVPPARSPLRQLFTHRLLMHYHRLIALVFAGNVAAAGYGTWRDAWWSDPATALPTMSSLVLANFALAILVRQQYVINLLFWLATRAPTHWPLRVRRTLAKVYHFGGLHVGGAVAGTLWFVAYVVTLTQLVVRGERPPLGLVPAYLMVTLLVGIVVFALPPLRNRRHDRFERTHRFGGWAVLVLFWAQTVGSVAADRGRAGLGAALLSSPSVWILALLTASVALPWLRLRRVPVRVERRSSHVALVRFDCRTPFTGSSTTVSRDPLWEWHAFANVPTPGERGFRLTISRAGDWTGSLIDDAPSHLWIKGITTAGVANIEKLFTRVVYVATGSGIGPVLPHLLAGEVPARLVWSARSPRVTYGDALVDEILAAQPNAVIWDTTTSGKPDMVALAYQAYMDFGAEAVICISNKKLTWQVVSGMESRNIPAYGAIWDS